MARLEVGGAIPAGLFEFSFLFRSQIFPVGSVDYSAFTRSTVAVISRRIDGHRFLEAP